MKNLVAALALATLVASPAFAQSYDPDVGTGNIAHAPYGGTAGAANAFAQVPRAYATSPRSDVVTDEGGHVQADPDLNIRTQLLRENNEF
jgi:hypothetical protein